MGQYVEIEASVDIDVDDYLEYATTEAMKGELLSRGEYTLDDESEVNESILDQSKREFIEEILDEFTEEELRERLGKPTILQQSIR